MGCTVHLAFGLAEGDRLESAMVKLYRKPGLQCLLSVVIAALVGKALGLGMYDPCTTPGLATKVRRASC